jgi:hypothetical protein
MERFERLIAAEIVSAEDRRERAPLVREFVTEFHGLSSTSKSKAVLDRVGARGMSLRDVHASRDLMQALLIEMCVQSSPVSPLRLGVVGEAHLALCARSIGASPDTFRYRRKPLNLDGVPYVVEAAFAYISEIENGRHLDVAGINFSPVIGQPFGFLRDVYASQRIEADEPTMLFMHLASPRLDFTDKGKSSLSLPAPVIWALRESFVGVTDAWRKQRDKETRDVQAKLRRAEALDREKHRHRLTQKAAAFQVMEAAWFKASDGGRLPANARQILYPARTMIVALTGEVIDSQYFTQTLLPAYQEEFEPDWEPAYDARGHFTEPHTGYSAGLGTLDVAAYEKGCVVPLPVLAALAKAMIKTCGPLGRIAGVAFIEKEGFLPLIRAAKIAEKHDLLITSSKGFSVVAVRKLIDILCGRFGLPLYILHDFDISGFGIAKTLVHDSHRYTFWHKIARIHDCGLRLGDIAGLPNEKVMIGKDCRAIVAHWPTCSRPTRRGALAVEHRDISVWNGDAVEKTCILDGAGRLAVH